MKFFQVIILFFIFGILGCKTTNISSVNYRVIPPVNPDNTVNAIVEIPSGTTAKYEMNKDSYTIEMDSINGYPRYIDYLGYPGNYGMIPNTILPKTQGGDGDPLDVLILGKAEDRGAVLKVKIIGVMELLDNGEQDDKLIAVKSNSKWNKIKDLEELEIHYPGVKKIISTFFQNYKGPNQMKLQQWSGRTKALQILENSIPNESKN